MDDRKNKDSHQFNLKKRIYKLRNKINRKKGSIFYHQYQIAFILIPLGFIFLIFYPNFINKQQAYPDTRIGKNIQIPTSSDRIAMVSKEYDRKNLRMAIVFVRNNGAGSLEDNKNLHFATDEITTTSYHVQGFRLNSYSYELFFTNLPKTFKTLYIRISTSDDENLVNKSDPFNGGESSTSNSSSNSNASTPTRIFVNNDNKLSFVNYDKNAVQKTSIEAESYRQKLIKNQIKIAEDNIKDYQKYISKQQKKITGYKQDLEYSAGDQSTEIKQSIDDIKSNITSTKSQISTLNSQINEAKKQILLSEKQQNAMLTNNYNFQDFTVHKIR